MVRREGELRPPPDLRSAQQFLKVVDSFWLPPDLDEIPRIDDVEGKALLAIIEKQKGAISHYSRYSLPRGPRKLKGCLREAFTIAGVRNEAPFCLRFGCDRNYDLRIEISIGNQKALSLWQHAQSEKGSFFIEPSKEELTQGEIAIYNQKSWRQLRQKDSSILRWRVVKQAIERQGVLPQFTDAKVRREIMRMLVLVIAAFGTGASVGDAAKRSFETARQGAHNAGFKAGWEVGFRKGYQQALENNMQVPERPPVEETTRAKIEEVALELLGNTERLPPRQAWQNSVFENLTPPQKTYRGKEALVGKIEYVQEGGKHLVVLITDEKTLSVVALPHFLISGFSSLEDQFPESEALVEEVIKEKILAFYSDLWGFSLDQAGIIIPAHNFEG